VSASTRTAPDAHARSWLLRRLDEALDESSAKTVAWMANSVFAIRNPDLFDFAAYMDGVVTGVDSGRDQVLLREAKPRLTAADHRERKAERTRQRQARRRQRKAKP
jgi:hypothetical protein